MTSRKSVQSEYKYPVSAAVNEASAYLQATEDTQACPFAEYFKAHQLQNPQSYIERSPSIGPRVGLNEGEALEQSVHSYHLAKLLDAAFLDTTLLYDPVHRYLKTHENTSDLEALRIIRGSLRLARHYASLSPSDGAYLMFAVSKDPKTGLAPERNDMATISRVNFSKKHIKDIILPRQRNGVGCSALNIMVYSPKRRPQRLFNLYWDALTVRAYERYLALPSYR